MENIVTFKNFIDIGEKVFEHLNFTTTLDCMLVCQSWNQILTDPMFWLKKLKKMGQTSKASKKWIDLILKSKGLEISTIEITKALLHMRVTKLINLQRNPNFDFEQSKETILMQPPVVSAAKLGLMDVMETLAKMGENFDQIHLDYIQSVKDNLRSPLILALKERNFAVADFILSKMKTPILKINEGFRWNVFQCAVQFGHLDLVKRMLPIMDEPSFEFKAVNLAILQCQIEVLEYLAPLLTENELYKGITLAMKFETHSHDTAPLKVLFSYASDLTMKTFYNQGRNDLDICLVLNLSLRQNKGLHTNTLMHMLDSMISNNSSELMPRSISPEIDARKTVLGR